MHKNVSKFCIFMPRNCLKVIPLTSNPPETSEFAYAPGAVLQNIILKLRLLKGGQGISTFI